MDNKTKIRILVAVLVAAILVVWAVWFKGGEPESTPAGRIGGEFLEKAQNPIKGEIGESNPFKVEANPFSKQTNPYEGVYENPFK